MRVVGSIVMALLACCKQNSSDAPKPVPAVCGNDIVEPGEACDFSGRYDDECPDGWAVCKICRSSCTVGLSEFVVASARELDLPGVVSITWDDGMGTYAYDAKGHLVHKVLTGSVDQERRYDWDDRGRLSHERGRIGQESDEHRYEYADNSGRRTTRSFVRTGDGWEPNGEIIEEIDPSGRVVASTSAGGTTRWTYNASGLVDRVQSRHLDVGFEYDDHERKTKQITPQSTTEYIYDYAGRLATEIVEFGLGGPGIVTTAYSYDGDRLVKKVVVDQNTTTTLYAHDLDGNLVDKVIQKGDASPFRTRYAYDLALLRRWRADAPWRKPLARRR